ncbi:MAG: VWA domain-containing protein [Deltaproteobacteria bacterium]|nr:VWA domain-containing protein [Deltaproteobacteria bacterium]
MKERYRYSRWDGSQIWSEGDAGNLFDELMERIADSGEVQWGLDRLLWDGFSLEERNLRFSGLSDLLGKLQEKRQEIFNRYHLEDVLKGIRQKLQDVLSKEKRSLEKTLQQKLQEIGEKEKKSDLDSEEREKLEKERLRHTHDISRRQDHLDHLPHSLSQSIEALDRYPFNDPEAKKDFEKLKGSLQAVKVLENFIDRYGKRFQGQEAADFVKGLELMELFKKMKSMEQSMQIGDLSSVSEKEVGEILGPQAVGQMKALAGFSQVLEEYGYLELAGGRLELTPKGIRRIGQKALKDIYASLKKDRIGSHELYRRGVESISYEGSRPYQYGDPFHLNYVETFKNALSRSNSIRFPIELREKDFEVFESEQTTRSATVLLLDMSWSMSWNDKFHAAKKVSLALDHLIRTKFSRDDFHIVGFFTTAIELKSKDLPMLDINLGDPWTNLQDGLRLASKILSHQPHANKQIIIITDGQPTCYFQEGQLHVEWPVMGVSPRASEETLREVQRCTRAGIKINTFMLDEEPALVAFVEQMTRINKGRSFFTRPDTLGQYLLIDYLQGKRHKIA